MPVQGVFSALAALVGTEQNIFFLAVHYFSSFVLCLSMCLWTKPAGHLALYSEEYSVKNNFPSKKRSTYDGENLQNFPLNFLNN